MVFVDRRRLAGIEEKGRKEGRVEGDEQSVETQTAGRSADVSWVE